MLGKSIKFSTVLLVSSVGLIYAPTASAVGAQVATPTSYALTASGYATSLSGGSVPAGSGKTAFQVVACTNLAGLSKWNTQASIHLPGLATVAAASTHAFTTSAGDKVSAWSTERITKVTLVNVGLASLSLDGIDSVSHAYHDSTGYHSTAVASLGSITVTTLGVPVDYPVPPAGQTITVAGIAQITVGVGDTTATAYGAAGTVNGVTVHFIPTDTTLVLANSHATISGNVKSALFHGNSTGAQASAAGGAVRLGKTPYLVMKCKGTGGTTLTRDVASADLGALGSASGLSTSESATSTLTHASSWQQADVTTTSLLGGTLQISGVTGRASASYVKGGAVQTSSMGTQVAQVTLDGAVVTLPAQGSIDLPGVATLSTDVETQYSNGLAVTALRVTMLDGSGVTIDLCTVRTFIQPSGL